MIGQEEADQDRHHHHDDDRDGDRPDVALADMREGIGEIVHHLPVGGADHDAARDPEHAQRGDERRQIGSAGSARH